MSDSDRHTTDSEFFDAETATLQCSCEECGGIFYSLTDVDLCPRCSERETVVMPVPPCNMDDCDGDLGHSPTILPETIF